MSRDLAILQQRPWFLSSRYRQSQPEDTSGYPLSYRLVICRALAAYIERDSTRGDKGALLLGRAIDAITSAGTPFSEAGFMEIHHLHNGQGVVGIDQTNGCYPLILYSDQVPRSGYARITAFRDALQDVRGKWPEILPVLRRKRVAEWD